MTGPTPPLVLASGSATRARMLADAGLTFETVSAGVDEVTARESMDAEGANASEMAVTLARLKAERVSQRKPGALVIGADQILALEDRRFDKPIDRASARECLVALRGRRHTLDTAACVTLDSAVIWRGSATARLTMRDFSDNFLDSYIAGCGEDDLAAVGAYRIEGRGAQLFSRIDGDLFAILGLPLLELLEFLRGRGAVER